MRFHFTPSVLATDSATALSSSGFEAALCSSSARGMWKRPASSSFVHASLRTRAIYSDRSQLPARCNADHHASRAEARCMHMSRMDSYSLLPMSCCLCKEAGSLASYWLQGTTYAPLCMHDPAICSQLLHNTARLQAICLY